MTVDDIITQVTEASSWDEAYGIICRVTNKAKLLAVADQLYIETDRMSANGVRKAIITEARS